MYVIQTGPRELRREAGLVLAFHRATHAKLWLDDARWVMRRVGNASWQWPKWMQDATGGKVFLYDYLTGAFNQVYSRCD